MRKLSALATLALGLTFPGLLQAQEIRMFTDQQLVAAAAIYAPNVEWMLRHDLARRLPASQRTALAGVEIVMPLRGGHPLQFAAQPSDQTLIMPASSLKFIDELTIVAAWFEERDCDVGYVHSYLSATLRYGGIGVSPLGAFGLSMGVTDREQVNDLSLKLSKTAVFFLLAHEAGHLMLGHHPGAASVISQAQEAAADAFALDIMARAGVPPAGMVYYLLAAQMLEPLPDLETWELEEEVIGEFTHPLSADRVRRIADRLAEAPLNFAHSESDPVRGADQVRYIAKQLAGIAQGMHHGGVVLYSASWLLDRYPVEDFLNACPGS
jgi:hypothetical protein